MGEGDTQGAKDVSEKITDEDQLLGAQQKGQQPEPQQPQDEGPEEDDQNKVGENRTLKPSPVRLPSALCYHSVYICVYTINAHTYIYVPAHNRLFSAGTGRRDGGGLRWHAA